MPLALPLPLPLSLPPCQVDELRQVMTDAGMPWPGDEGEERWEQAWQAIKKVRVGAGVAGHQEGESGSRRGRPSRS